MFNLFKKKEPEIKVVDKIVIDESAKLKAMLSQWNSNKNIVFVFWFDESLHQAETWFTGQIAGPVALFTVREATTPQVAGKAVVFAEHYPLRRKEQELFQRLKLEEVIVFSSLKEPLFQRFGSDKIIQMMQQLGMKDDEVMEHNMISKAIRNAQEKIEKKVLLEQLARSQEDWLNKNLPA